jgi:recombination protein RecT
VIEVWPIARVKKHRDRYNRVGNRHYSHQNWEMYARKTVLLQVIKYMPASADLAAAVALNDAAEMGHQNLTINDAIDGTWSPVVDEAVDAETGEIVTQEQ